MPNIGKLFKEEIVRLSKKNALVFARPLKEEVRDLKRTLRAMSQELQTLRRAIQHATPASASAAESEAHQPAVRTITGKGIRALRRKFKLTQAQLAALAGVSSQAVVLWERKTGKIRFRQKTLAALNAVREMNKAGIKAALTEGSKKGRR